MPRTSASDAAAARARVPRTGAPRRVGEQHEPQHRARRAAGVVQVRPSSSENSSNRVAVESKSSAAGKAGSGAGAYGPSNVATWSCPASGSSADERRVLGVRGELRREPRAAAAAATGEPPQITGSRPTRSSASDLAGLTNDSLDGRHWCEMSSIAVAAAS